TDEQLTIAALEANEELQATGDPLNSDSVILPASKTKTLEFIGNTYSYPQTDYAADQQLNVTLTPTGKTVNSYFIYRAINSATEPMNGSELTEGFKAYPLLMAEVQCIDEEFDVEEIKTF